jgi:hypothetical protein
VYTRTISFGWATGNGRNKIASATLVSAAASPIPKASDPAASAANPGCLAKMRIA